MMRIETNEYLPPSLTTLVDRTVVDICFILYIYIFILENIKV